MRRGGTPISVSFSEHVALSGARVCIHCPSLSCVSFKHAVWSFSMIQSLTRWFLQTCQESGVVCVLLSHAGCSNRSLIRGSSDVTGRVGCINSWIWSIKSSLFSPLCDSVVGNHIWRQLQQCAFLFFLRCDFKSEQHAWELFLSKRISNVNSACWLLIEDGAMCYNM